ncbi:hypothetical protein [Criblamydia sequanensis]|uniref:Uncharacterized protein n=1 Tax=Candidatus Criblamydia sequanensis CRIB-18 TaxID=1437425 RepID=A0A090E2X6_9BACT|nr:hypothetical protein [Criblamydia sequanensis]CDR34984.1 hypothetical protein CSEC_2178 [Criblamydia sequanensis CRIB-18]
MGIEGPKKNLFNPLHQRPAGQKIDPAFIKKEDMPSSSGESVPKKNLFNKTNKVEILRVAASIGFERERLPESILFPWLLNDKKTRNEAVNLLSRIIGDRKNRGRNEK